MRLLDTRTRRLKFFHSHRAVPSRGFRPSLEYRTYAYAILSHCWREEEVTFADLASRNEESLRSMAGYRKIHFACENALASGWEYVWIDTCCIDKSSSAELSEAINSMWMWYRDSAICYVFSG